MRSFFVVAVIALAITIGPAFAAYPDRPIKVLMPFPPGGTVDVVTRLVCNEASELLGKPLVLDYRPGAAGIIASEAVARAQPDGYTVLVTTPSHHQPGTAPQDAVQHRDGFRPGKPDRQRAGAPHRASLGAV
jgi:tripartite-type tricarboxylate transporter receptor subunit TctC